MARNNRLVLLIATLAVSFIGVGHPAGAQNTEFKKIAADEALLDVGIAGRALVGVEAGRISNKLYVEKWQFDNSALNFQKLSGHTYFSASSFSEARTLQRYCGEDPELRCGGVEIKQHSKNLISIVYRRENGGAVCAGLDYIDEDGRATGRRPRLYGNYIVSLVHCGAPGSDPNEVLAHGAHYLAAAKKDGRSIAKIAHYDLPKLRDPAAAPSRRGTVDSAYAQAPDRRVCNMATEGGAWQQQRSLQKWVDEAKGRGLTPKSCGFVLSAN